MDDVFKKLGLDFITPYCASLTEQVTLQSSIIGWILTGLESTENEWK